MIKKLLIIASLAIVGFTQAQNYSGGNGTVTNPYLISNKADLKYLSADTARWHTGYYFKQTTDITFTSTDFSTGGAFYNGGAGFSPIGNDTVQFTGNYNGNYHIIDSLYINRSSQSYVALFGWAFNDTIKNLGLKNVSIKGSWEVGALIGYNDGGFLSQCYSTGKINGYANTGGFIGENGGGALSNCYNLCAVTGTQSIGGLMGRSHTGTALNCYSTGSVNGNLFVGGLTANHNGTYVHCFWDVQTSGQATSYGGTGDSTYLMKKKSTFTDSTWDFVGETANGTADIWAMNQCNNNGYPILSWQVIPISVSGVTISSNTTGLSYQWINCGNNAAISGATGSSYIATANGNYAVIVNHGACSDTSACISITSVGIQSFISNPLTLIKIFPNPNNGNFSLQAESELGLIQVYNSLGQLVYSQNSKETLLQIDLSLEATGLYYVQAHGQYLKVTKQ